MRQQVVHAGMTSQGRVRKQNQDRWFADPRMGLYLVSDGMGGGYAGGLATQIVVDALPPLIHDRMSGVEAFTGQNAIDRVGGALSELSDYVHGDSKGQPGLDGMGATVVLALIRGGQTLIAHMGDSRAYLLRQLRLEQLTKDHSLVQVLLDVGEITPEVAIEHPARGQLTRFVGMPQHALPHSRVLPLLPGDQLLLCSDGLTSMVSDEEIKVILDQTRTPYQACKRLISAANEAGGLDNITSVVVRIA